MMWGQVSDHLLAATFSALSFAAGSVMLTAGVLGAQVPDGVVVGVSLFLAGTMVSFIGWLALSVVRVSSLVAEMSAQVREHERRLNTSDTRSPPP